MKPQTQQIHELPITLKWEIMKFQNGMHYVYFGNSPVPECTNTIFPVSSSKEEILTALSDFHKIPISTLELMASQIQVGNDYTKAEMLYRFHQIQDEIKNLQDELDHLTSKLA